MAAPEPGAMTRMPLPGEQVPNFELPAVVGDDIQNIRLSDYDSMWRVVCFYPAGFTFVWPTELSAVAEKCDELIRQVQAMQIVAENPSKAAPAGWTPQDGEQEMITAEKADIGRY